MITKSCDTCGYRTLNPHKCQLIGSEYSSTAACPYHTTTLNICAHCNQITISPVFRETSADTWITLCGNCANLFGTCYLCSQSFECVYETDPSPLPKAVIKTYKSVQIQEKNPSRIDITCRQKCPCFSEEFGCLRENGTCGNYKEKKL